MKYTGQEKCSRTNNNDFTVDVYEKKRKENSY